MVSFMYRHKSRYKHSWPTIKPFSLEDALFGIPSHISSAMSFHVLLQQHTPPPRRANERSSNGSPSAKLSRYQFQNDFVFVFP